MKKSETGFTRSPDVTVGGGWVGVAMGTTVGHMGKGGL